jgi:gamma-glutamylcyclotransferase (GGCT)/AIG2-like uncharacterized protein YtfP
MIQRLFVYGSLRPGQSNEHVLKAIGGTWQEASVRGHLKQVVEASGVYPAIVLDATADVVTGYIFHCDTLDQHWKNLDEFEGEAYKRILVTVQTKDHIAIEAYIYALR